MKNILLIITLFISWNVVAEEKVWYCSSETMAGLDYEDGKWVTKSFYPPKRIIIKQIKDRLIFPIEHDILGTLEKKSNCTTDFEGFIYCSRFALTFALNPKNGLATHANYQGDLDGINTDSLMVAPWKCESF